MRLTWLANAPWTPTGYGNQTALFPLRLQKAGHEMAIIAFWGYEGTPMNWKGVQIFGRSFHPFAMDIMHSHSVTWKADAMISLLDAWVVDVEGLQGTRWIPWFPIDQEPIPEAITSKIGHAFARVVMSKFGAAQMDSFGMDYSYIPHGVDTSVFKPLDRVESRAKMQLPMDKFIVGMVAANKGNPSRKAFHQNIMGFAALQRKYKDCVLYLHTVDGVFGQALDAINIPSFLDAIGLSYGYAFGREPLDNKDVIIADQYGMALGYPDGQMAMLYNAMDVKLLVSMGEGFGIPLLEAQACGTPVVVGDWTSMPELCFSGWKVPKSEAEPIFTNIHGFQYLPRPAAIAERLEAAYQMRGNMDYRTRAVDGAKAYDADRVTEKYWLPFLKDIEKKIAQENETISKAKALTGAPHVHEWGAIGLYIDGVVCAPCIGCTTGMRGNEIVENLFPTLDDLDFIQDTDGINRIVMREVRNDYHLDDFTIPDGGVILDIGAHKGIVSCYLAKKYPQATIYAFEPVKENYAALLENVKRNNITNVVAANIAVTKDGRPVRMVADAYRNSGGANIYGNGQQEAQSTTLDEVFKVYNIEHVSLLKIDCEGAEYEILGSANGLLKRVDAMRGEFHRARGNAEELLKHVRAEIPDVVVTLQG